MNNEGTQIPVKKSTRKRLRELGNKGETYDEVLNKLLDKIKESG